MSRCVVLDVEGPALYAIIDLPHAGGVALADAVASVVAGGARWVQLRAKRGWPSKLAAAQGAAWAPILEAARAGPARLVINDDAGLAVELAARSGRDGPTIALHLGQEDWAALGAARVREVIASGLEVGLSTHGLAQVRAAGASGVAYIGFGPVFDTGSKANPEPTVGVAALAAACDLSRVPVVAIGGMDPSRVPEVVEAGAAGIACISALVADDAEGIERAANGISRAIELAKRR